MATLKTDYTDDVLNASKNKLRKYQQINNDDGTVSFVDVTDYTSVGSELKSTDINAITKQINSNTGKIGEADISAVGDGTTTGAIAALNESLTAFIPTDITDDFSLTNIMSFSAIKCGNMIQLFFLAEASKECSIITDKWKPRFQQEYKCLNYSSWATSEYQLCTAKYVYKSGLVFTCSSGDNLPWSYITPMCCVYYI